MKLTQNQRNYINQRVKEIDGILAHEPRLGDINLRLQKQWLNNLLTLDKYQ